MSPTRLPMLMRCIEVACVLLYLLAAGLFFYSFGFVWGIVAACVLLPLFMVIRMAPKRLVPARCSACGQFG